VLGSIVHSHRCYRFVYGQDRSFCFHDVFMEEDGPSVIFNFFIIFIHKLSWYVVTGNKYCGGLDLNYCPDEGQRPLSDPRPPLGYCSQVDEWRTPLQFPPSMWSVLNHLRHTVSKGILMRLASLSELFSSAIYLSMQ
jgi:hypothetical protein